MLGKDEIENRFGFHKATIEGANATQPRHKNLRRAFCDFATYLDMTLEDGRNKEIAFDELENASMRAHKALAEEAPLIEE